MDLAPLKPKLPKEASQLLSKLGASQELVHFFPDIEMEVEHVHHVASRTILRNAVPELLTYPVEVSPLL